MLKAPPIINSITDISVSKIYILATEPTNKTKDRFWFDTTNNILKRYDGTTWKPISVSSDNVVVLSDGSKISLTTYLNNQISALAEGIDTKQDKLNFYSESEYDANISNNKGDIYLSTPNGILGISANTVSLNGDLSGTAIHSSISSVPSDSKLLTEKAISTALETKQRKLSTYSESSSSGGLLSAAITAEVELLLDSKQIKIGGGSFNSETIIDGWAKGYAGTSKIKVNGSSISLQETASDGDGSSIELTEDTLAINSTKGITGNILEKTISSSSADTKIPTAKAVYTAVNAKANKSTTLSGYGITNAYTKTEVDTELNKKQDTLHTYTETSSLTRAAEPVGYNSTINADTLELKGQNLVINNNIISGSSIDKTFDVSTSTFSENSLPTSKFVYDLVDYNVSNLGTGVYAELDKKQDKLTTYTETPVSDSTGVIGSTVQINGVAITLNPTNNGSVILHNSITGSAISTSIPTSNAVDTKLPSEKAVRTELDKKQNKLYGYSEDIAHPVGEPGMIVSLGESPNTTGIIIDDRGGSYEWLTLNGDIKGTAIATSISGTPSDNKLVTEKCVAEQFEAINDSYTQLTNDIAAKQDKLTAGTNITISNNKISVSGLTKSSVGLGNVDNTSDKNKPISTATQTALDAKQNALNYYSEDSNGNATVGNATSFQVSGTSNGLFVKDGNGGITIQNNSFKAGQAIISLAANAWNDGSAILLDVEGQTVSLSDALLIPEIKNKQDISDSSLTTNDKTIVGAINELNNQVNTTIPEPITSVYTISSTSLSSFISNTTYAGVSGQILISADVSNTGPILVGENISDKSNAFPIYPDQIFPIPFSDINNFKVTGTVNDKFNYIISFRSLSNTSPVANGGITILNENGYYKLTPEGEGDTATLVITKLK